MLRGHEGLRQEFMGLYRHNGEFNGCLRYEGQPGVFLYKVRQSGCWCVTASEKDIEKGTGVLSSVEVTSSTPVGLQWEWGDGQAWHVDSNLRCSAEAGVWVCIAACYGSIFTKTSLTVDCYFTIVIK